MHTLIANCDKMAADRPRRPITETAFCEP